MSVCLNDRKFILDIWIPSNLFPCNRGLIQKWHYFKVLFYPLALSRHRPSLCKIGTVDFEPSLIWQRRLIIKLHKAPFLFKQQDIFMKPCPRHAERETETEWEWEWGTTGSKPKMSLCAPHRYMFWWMRWMLVVKARTLFCASYEWPALIRYLTPGYTPCVMCPN